MADFNYSPTMKVINPDDSGMPEVVSTHSTPEGVVEKMSSIAGEQMVIDVDTKTLNRLGGSKPVYMQLKSKSGKVLPRWNQYYPAADWWGNFRVEIDKPAYVWEMVYSNRKESNKSLIANSMIDAMSRMLPTHPVLQHLQIDLTRTLQPYCVSDDIYRQTPIPELERTTTRVLERANRDMETSDREHKMIERGVETIIDSVRNKIADTLSSQSVPLLTALTSTTSVVSSAVTSVPTPHGGSFDVKSDCKLNGAVSTVTDDQKRTAPNLTPKSGVESGIESAVKAVYETMKDESAINLAKIKSWYDSNSHQEQVPLEDGVDHFKWIQSMNITDLESLRAYVETKPKSPMFIYLLGCIHYQSGHGASASCFKHAASAGLHVAMLQCCSLQLIDLDTRVSYLAQLEKVPQVWSLSCV